VTAIAEFIKVSWLFPVIQSVHLIGITLLVGTIALMDLRRLGLVLRRHEISALATDLSPWTAAGFLTIFLTGPLLFWADLGRYLVNPAFVVKMILLAVALVSHLTIHRAAVTPATQRLAALISLMLWAAVVLAGRAIADFDLRQA